MMLSYLFLFFLSGRWVNAEAAVLLAFFEVVLLRSCWEAILPTRFEVFSFLAISKFLFSKSILTIINASSAHFIPIGLRRENQRVVINTLSAYRPSLSILNLANHVPFYVQSNRRFEKNQIV